MEQEYFGVEYIGKALCWYRDHHEHVTKMVQTVDKFYAPTELYDIINPAVWKPEYWKWFVTEFLIIQT